VHGETLTIAPVMRSHRDIIRDAGGALKVHRRLPNVKLETVKSWSVRNRIPCDYWRALIDCEFCSADELVTAVAVRRERRAAAA
jgi:hypothetical protein